MDVLKGACVSGGFCKRRKSEVVLCNWDDVSADSKSSSWGRVESCHVSEGRAFCKGSCGSVSVPDPPVGAQGC